MENNPIVTAILSKWSGGSQIDFNKDTRVSSVLLNGVEFFCARKGARERSKMLLKAAPLTKLLGSMFSKFPEVRETFTNVDMQDMSDTQRIQMGSSIASALGECLSSIDSESTFNLMEELISWCDFHDELTDRRTTIKGTFYDKVFDKDLTLQIPILTLVVCTNYLDFFTNGQDV